MKLRILAFLFAFAFGLSAQNVPFGETLTQDGLSVALMPINPPNPLVAPFAAPTSLQIYGLMVSVTPIDLHATELFITADLTTSDAKARHCIVKVMITTNDISTTAFIFTDALTVTSVQSLEIITGTPSTFGKPVRTVSAGSCKLAD